MKALPWMLLASCLLAPVKGWTQNTAGAAATDAAGIELLDDLSAQEILEANRVLNRVEELIERGNYLEARELLTPLVGRPYFQTEIKQLVAEINRRRGVEDSKRRLAATESRAIADVHERLVLPDTYGQTVVISPKLERLELPPGPMDELINRKVDMNLEDADVATILDALREIDGLNIIADTALTESEGTLTVKVTQVKLSKILGYIARNMGLSFHLDESVVWVTAGDEEAAPKGPELETVIYHLRNGYLIEGGGGSGGGDTGGAGGPGGGAGSGFGVSAGSAGGGSDDLLEALEQFIEDNPDKPDDGKFMINRNLNMLVIRDTRKNLALVQRIIDEFDKIPPQIEIEARYIQIRQDELFNLGVSIVGPGDTPGITLEDTFPPKLNLSYSSPLPDFSNPLGGAGRLAVSGILDDLTYNAVLEAISQTSSAKTLSAPRVTVMNNQSATIRRGDTRFYFEEFEQQSNIVTGDNPVIANQVVPTGEAQELKLGITLTVTPSVGHERKQIVLAIQADIIQFIEMVTLGDNIQLPHTSDNTLTTKVAVNSGETIVLGGMVTSEANSVESKVPFLADLPLIGNAFKKRDWRETPDHLLIFVKATLIDSDGRYNRVEGQEPQR